MVWHKYKKYSDDQPRNESSFDRSEIPCLVKMSDGEIWSANWIFDYTDYHHRDFEGWRFRSMWGERTMKRRVLKKKAKRAGERITGKDNTYHNILVYFYKQITINGSKFYVYTASPKIRNGSGTPYRYALWRRNIEC